MVKSRETFGWRGKIGYVSPAGDFRWMRDLYPLLPDGVVVTLTTLGVGKLVREDAEMVFKKYPAAAKHLASQECDVIIVAGSLVFSLLGYKRAQEMIQKEIRDVINVPVIEGLEADFDAFRALNAKRIVLVSPYEEERNTERIKLCEEMGFQVLAHRFAGIQERVKIGQLPAYASYALAREAVAEAPEAEAIYISCPEWPTTGIIDQLEQDTGKPVVANGQCMVWAALRVLHIKGPKGYGRLMELL